MQTGSDKHGSRADDALSKEVRGLTQGGREGTLTGGTPDGITRSDLDDRAELATLLGKEIWPARAGVIKERIRESNGPERLRELVASLPEGAYENVGEVWAALTGERETQRF